MTTETRGRVCRNSSSAATQGAGPALGSRSHLCRARRRRRCRRRGGGRRSRRRDRLDLPGQALRVESAGGQLGTDRSKWRSVQANQAKRRLVAAVRARLAATEGGERLAELHVGNAAPGRSRASAGRPGWRCQSSAHRRGRRTRARFPIRKPRPLVSTPIAIAARAQQAGEIAAQRLEQPSCHAARQDDGDVAALGAEALLGAHGWASWALLGALLEAAADQVAEGRLLGVDGVETVAWGW